MSVGCPTSWQILPDTLIELATDPDAKKSQRVMAAMMRMKKIDIAKLHEVATG